MRVLVVEDEPRMSELLHRGLTEDGHTVDVGASGAAARDLLRYADYDVVVLDWGLPDVDGLSLLREWRAQGVNTPVLMLTARGTSGEKVLGLRTGADDYLVKPFDFEEFVARLEALHRRAGGAGSPEAALGDVGFSRSRRQLSKADNVLDLTGREFQVLCTLQDRAGDVVSRSELIAKVWGPHFDGEPNVVDVYIGYLRTKFRELGAVRVSIGTVRGAGYRLVVTAPEAP